MSNQRSISFFLHAFIYNNRVTRRYEQNHNFYCDIWNKDIN